jgi:RNA polymerase sigma-70 factor (ECF subfamily)
VLRACLGPDAAIDDVVQETFLALHRSLERVAEPDSLRAYLLGCATRLAAFEVRSRSRRFRWLRLTLTGDLPEPEPRRDSTDDRDALRILQGVLQELSADVRAAFVLRYVEDLSPRDVARALGVSESTAKRLAARARDRVLMLAAPHPELAIYLGPVAKEHRR